jgi:hypothetical protein
MCFIRYRIQKNFVFHYKNYVTILIIKKYYNYNIMSGYSNYLGAKKCCATNLAKTVTGAQGSKGSQGEIGPYGQQGSTGSQGAQGVTGACCRGPQGFTGAQGPAGGAQGATGPQGAIGTQGDTGAQGATGSGFQGATGAQGDTGAQGATGSGFQGATGTQGATGAQGDTGAQGATGSGFQGATGTQGATGGSPWINMNGTGPQGQGYTGIGVTGQDVLIYGNLLVTGAIDPTSLSFSQTTGGPTGSIWYDTSNNIRMNNVKVNNTLLCDAGTTGKTTSISDGSVVVNGNGLTNAPVLTLNQTGTGTGILYEEMYNQRTAQTGEFNRMSFYGKNSSGVKTEYARIHQNTPIIGVGSERGRMDLAVRDGGGISDYIRVNGSTANVEIFKNTNLNNNLVYNVSNIQNINSLLYKPTQTHICNSITQTITAPSATGEQIFVLSEGITNFASSYIDPATISPAPNPDTYSATYFLGANLLIIAVGKFLYKWDTGSSSWIQFYAFDAVINCIVEFNGSLYVGGDFSQDVGGSTFYNHIAKFDTALNPFQLVWNNRSSDIGFSGRVYTLCPNDIGSPWLYVGGDFTKTGTSGSYDLLRFGCIETNAVDLYSIDDNSGGINGFDNNVRTISCSSNRIFIGGDFTTQYASISGTQNTYNIQYGCIWTSNDYQSLNSPEIENIGSSPSSINSNILTSVKDPVNPYFHFGGQFVLLDGLFSYIGYCDVTTPSTIGSYNTFNDICYSIKTYSGGNNFIYAKEGNTTGNLYLVAQNQIISPSTPNGIMTGCYDNNTGLFTFFFSNQDIITSFNPTLNTKIDLTSLGIGVLSGGTIYTNYIELNGSGSYFTGVGAITSNLSPPTIFAITSSYATSFYN